MKRSNGQKSLSLQILTSQLVLIGIALAGLVGFFQHEVRSADRTAIDRQVRFAARALASEIAAMPEDQRSATIWDEAVERTEARDFDWIDGNMGAWMQAYFGHDESFVLDRDDGAFFASVAGTRLPPETYDVRAEIIGPLVAQLRADMDMARPFQGPPAEGLGELAVVAPVRLGDGPAIVSVVPILAETDEVSQAPGSEMVHVAVRYLDGPFAERLGQPIELDQAAFTTDPPGTGSAAIPVTDPAGADIAWLTWQPERPGRELLMDMMPVLLVAGLLGAVLLWWFVHRLMRVSGQLQVSEAQARFLAHHDALTGLPNRNLFQDRLALAMQDMDRAGRKVALLAVDLDRFKLINDSFGHAAGDELIRQVGSRLVSIAGPQDTVARFGGDEFMIILHDAPDDVALTGFCARIVEDLSRPYELLGNHGSVGASVGAVRAVSADEDRDELMRRADLALYRAKAEGKGRYSLFEEKMEQLVEQRNQIESDLRSALDTGTGLTLDYQPFYDQDGRLTGAEALCRWDHPEHGALSPEIFIRVAEERGLIDQLGQQMLRQACAFAVGTSLPKVAVNVSPLQLRNPGFLEMVLKVLDETGLAPARLELELTEKVILDQTSGIAEKIRQLRAAGITIALDDFATGNSSLQYLRDHRVDSVKIDRSFVARLGKDEECDNLVQAIFELARAMGISVTVEGVETELQHTRLAAMGCKTFQGYLLRRPMEATRFAALLRDGEFRVAGSA